MTDLRTDERHLPGFWKDLDIFSYIWPRRDLVFVAHGLMMMLGFYALWTALTTFLVGSGVIGLALIILACVTFLILGFLAFSRMLSVPYFIYRRRKMLALKYGVPTRGRVVSLRPIVADGEVHKNMLVVDYEYRAGDGELRRGREVTIVRTPDQMALWEVGEPVVVFYDTLDPERSSLPELYDVSIAETRAEEVEDNRPDWNPSPHARVDGVPSTQVVAQLKVSSSPSRDAWWELGGRESAFARRGVLRMTDESLIAHTPERDGVTVSLMEPFSMRLEAWLRNEEEAELIVTVRGRGAAARDGGICFKVLVPQRALNRRIPLRARPGAPFVSLKSFSQMWPVLQATAQMHGEPVQELVRLKEVAGEVEAAFVREEARVEV